jgi:hypothetical protein
MTHDITKHLEFIQSTITRMANNSFLIKGWTITLAAAMFALAGKDSDISPALVALLPSLAFWGLDAYYLRQERLFRKLYEDICKKVQRKQDIDVYTLSTKAYEKVTPSWFRALWSKPILFLHGTVVLTLLLVIALLWRYKY